MRVACSHSAFKLKRPSGPCRNPPLSRQNPTHTINGRILGRWPVVCWLSDVGSDFSSWQSCSAKPILKFLWWAFVRLLSLCGGSSSRCSGGFSLPYEPVYTWPHHKFPTSHSSWSYNAHPYGRLPTQIRSLLRIRGPIYRHGRHADFASFSKCWLFCCKRVQWAIRILWLWCDSRHSRRGWVLGGPFWCLGSWRRCRRRWRMRWLKCHHLISSNFSRAYSFSLVKGALLSHPSAKFPIPTESAQSAYFLHQKKRPTNRPEFYPDYIAPELRLRCGLWSCRWEAFSRKRFPSWIWFYHFCPLSSL